MTDKIKPRKTPCPTCPYRRDVPSGIWDVSEYDKLPEYDRSTSEQGMIGLIALFYCHQRTGELCAGWVGCHDMEENLAIRFSARKLDLEAIYDYESPVPLFASGAEAAEHGKRDFYEPSEEAEIAQEKLRKLREKRNEN